MNKNILTVAIISSLGAVAYSGVATAALAANANLSMNTGVISCILNAGTAPDNCTYGGKVTGGSYFGMDNSGNGIVSAVERVVLVEGSEGLNVPGNNDSFSRACKRIYKSKRSC